MLDYLFVLCLSHTKDSLLSSRLIAHKSLPCGWSLHSLLCCLLPALEILCRMLLLTPHRHVLYWGDLIWWNLWVWQILRWWIPCEWSTSLKRLLKLLLGALLVWHCVELAGRLRWWVTCLGLLWRRVLVTLLALILSVILDHRLFPFVENALLLVLLEPCCLISRQVPVQAFVEIMLVFVKALLHLIRRILPPLRTIKALLPGEWLLVWLKCLKFLWIQWLVKQFRLGGWILYPWHTWIFLMVLYDLLIFLLKINFLFKPLSLLLLQHLLMEQFWLAFSVKQLTQASAFLSAFLVINLYPLLIRLCEN